MRIINLLVLCLSGLLLVGCLPPDVQSFFDEYPKSDEPIYVSGRAVYLPLYDEHVEQLHLFGMGQCDAIRPLVQIPGQLLDFPGVEGACLVIFSVSQVESSDAGNYDELSFIIPIARLNDSGKVRISTYMHKMYLNPAAQFSIDLGKQIWGYPKESSEMLEYKSKGPIKSVSMRTLSGDHFEMKWAVRGQVDTTEERNEIDLVTPTGGVAKTVLRILSNINEVPFDSSQDKLVLEGELQQLASEINFIPVYWQNTTSNVVSGIED